MIKKKIEDRDLQEHLAALPDDGREVFLLHNDQIRVTAISATKLINQMRVNHELGLLETYVLGQAYLAGGLLSATVKGNDRIQLSIDCGGPIGGVFVESWAVGAVRGYLKHNPIPLKESLKSLDLNELYGPGFISVSKILEGHKSPFTGQTMMAYGDLAKDLALHYQQSEQTPSMFMLSLNFNKSGQVSGSGALFLQAMPGCDEGVLEELENLSTKLPSIGAYLAEGKTIRSYVEKQFETYQVRHLASQFMAFSCPCSREQYTRYLQHLNKEEQKDILVNGPFPLELVCVNCNTHYHYERFELEHLLSEAGGDTV
ncbi:Hsp33 family molecular chaperone HslO [Sphaerochaeta globosa]|uniref:Hsp33 protein n=1 Tax=Sphaerochaeta globosa (strain ATCC BAA-1886 / DSM 22777 / Buddy) TaxID=158189 RepID=F0RUX5_SPHGB|nr:Hsp33 family molecular chaperone HslO [Sphaerochaeta globosa]ADY12626.1 Hsp33 protein [Sphaerochaeta globosa str. Buddy]